MSAHPDQGLPKQAGLGFRQTHWADFHAHQVPAVAWLEVHSENYLVPGGPRLAQLEYLRQDYPISLHGVSASLGSAAGLPAEHLRRLRALCARIEPAMVSEHLAWCALDGVWVPDLLPLPYTYASLQHIAHNVERLQEALGRSILVENPSRYLSFAHDEMDEAEFLSQLVERTGCGVLLDVNNLVVSAVNVGGDPLLVLERLPLYAVGEVHIAGHAVLQREQRRLCIDDHGHPVSALVWGLLEVVLNRCTALPVLLERDTNIPPLSELLPEVQRAAQLIAALQPSSVAA